MQAEEKERDEVEESGPDDCELRRKDPRRNDRCDRIGGVVETVQEIEEKRQDDQKDDRNEGQIHAHTAGTAVLKTEEAEAQTCFGSTRTFAEQI